MDRIKGAEYYQQLLKGEVPVIGWVEGPLAEACDLAGVSEVLMKMILEPDFINLLLDKCLLTGIDFAIAQIEAGCDIIGIGDAICSQVDIDLYNGFVKERHKRMIDEIHARGGMVKLHICGNITHLLPSIAELGADIVDLDWQVETENAFNVLGEQTIRCGNINPVDIQDLDEATLSEQTTKLLEKEKGRRYILSGGCEITVLTPHQNLRLMGKLSKQS